MMHYACTPVFLSTGGLNSHTYIYGHGGVLSGTARKQVFWKGVNGDLKYLGWNITLQ